MGRARASRWVKIVIQDLGGGEGRDLDMCYWVMEKEQGGKV